MLVTNFNSIKVRLEPKQIFANARDLNKFQFHKGTIRTHCFECRNVMRSEISIP